MNRVNPCPLESEPFCMGDEAMRMQSYVRFQVSETELCRREGEEGTLWVRGVTEASWRIQTYEKETGRGRVMCL